MGFLQYSLIARYDEKKQMLVEESNFADKEGAVYIVKAPTSSLITKHVLIIFSLLYPCIVSHMSGAFQCFHLVRCSCHFECVTVRQSICLIRTLFEAK